MLGGAAIEELLDGQLSVLGDQMAGMCNMEALADGTFLLLYTGGKVVRIVYDPEASTFPDQQLNVYSLYDSERLRQAIQLYGQKNPEVYVNYEIGIPADSGVTLEDAQKNLNLAMLGEEGPDVVFLDGLDAGMYQEKGMLAELTDVVGSFSEESAVMENLLEACRTDGKLYEIPAQIKIPVVFGKQIDLAAVTDMASLADTVEHLRKQKPEGGITGSFHAKQELAQLLSLTGESFIADGQLDREAVKTFLEQAKRISAANLSGVEQAYTELFGQHQIAVSVGNKTTMVMTGLGEISYGLADSAAIDIGMMDALFKEGGYQMQLWSTDGKKAFLPVNRMAISATASHTESAKEFLKLMLSEEMQTIEFHDGFPVTQAAWENLCRPRKEGDADYICMGGSFQMPDGTYKEYSSEWPRAQIMEQVYNMAMQLNSCIEKNVWLEEAILEHGPNALLGVTNVEETVEKIARSVAIYLAE